METSSTIHDPKSVGRGGDDGPGTGPYDPGIQMNANSPDGSTYIDTTLANNPDDNDLDIVQDRNNNSRTNAGRGSMTPNEEDNVDEFVNVQGHGRGQIMDGSTNQSQMVSHNSKLDSSQLGLTSSMESDVVVSVAGQSYIESPHSHSGYAIDPSLGPRGNPQSTSSNMAYQKTHTGYQEQNDETAAAAVLASSAQADFYRQQPQMSQMSQMSNMQHNAQLQLQQAQLMQQRLNQHQQQHILHSQQQNQQANSPNQIHQTRSQHAQQALQIQSQQQVAYMSKQTNPISSHSTYHLQHQPQPHQLQQSTSANDEEELFVRHMSPNHQPENGNNTRPPQNRTMRNHQNVAAPYPGIEIIHSSQYTQGNIAGVQLTNQLSHFGDSMDVAAAAIGMDFGNMRQASPLSATPMTMVPPSNGTPSFSGGSARKRKASAISTPQGDSDSIAELKLMTSSNMSKPLSELAIQVREEENGSSAEKFRQTFAMAWLQKNCELSPDAAVPRNRIYARYVELCAQFSLKPLNPASFGKLVRVAYPGIKTRRLGVRGQSKYHYCGFRLIGEQNNPTGNTPTGTPGRFGNSPDRCVLYSFITAFLTLLA